MDKTTNGNLTFLRIARILTFLCYAYVVIATVFLILGFILLLFGANAASGFVHFVYSIAAQFLKPFREIFPGQQIGDRGYFSAAGLFAIIMYGIAAVALHSLITFITLKQTKHQQELNELQNHQDMTQAQTAERHVPPRPTRMNAPKQRL